MRWSIDYNSCKAHSSMDTWLALVEIWRHCVGSAKRTAPQSSSHCRGVAVIIARLCGCGLWSLRHQSVHNFCQSESRKCFKYLALHSRCLEFVFFWRSSGRLSLWWLVYDCLCVCLWLCICVVLFVCMCTCVSEDSRFGICFLFMFMEVIMGLWYRHVHVYG